MRLRTELTMAAALALALAASADARKELTPLECVLVHTKPLPAGVRGRVPLFLWTPDFPVEADDAALERTVRDLQARGIVLLHRWSGTPEATLAKYGRVGALQKKAGMPIAIDGTGIAHGFYSGDPALSHVDKEGKPFRDSSFFWSPGCPFAVQSRYEEKRKLTQAFADAYKAAGLTIDYWMGDWEFDGPNEWKDGWKTARSCTRCRERIPAIDTDFGAFQAAVRAVRSEMQAEGWVRPLCAAFPAARVGNYAMHPHDGYRYYWDFYEEKAPGEPAVVEGVAYRREQNALYRPWAKEFEPAGYNLAMPVVYSWFNLYTGYTFENRQFRWFRGMLLEGASAGASTPAEVPVVPFVHWSTTNPPKEKPAGFEPMSEAMYRELLWHLLLRGADSFCMWSPPDETALEVTPVHEVYAASLAFAEFLEKGTPLALPIPDQPGAVVSALRLGQKLLVRRTDFTDSTVPADVQVDGATVKVPRADGQCQVIQLRAKLP